MGQIDARSKERPTTVGAAEVGTVQRKDTVTSGDAAAGTGDHRAFVA